MAYPDIVQITPIGIASQLLGVITAPTIMPAPTVKKNVSQYFIKTWRAF